MIRKTNNLYFLWGFIFLLIFTNINVNLKAEILKFTLRNSTDSIHNWKEVKWKSDEVAIIICDMWDSHHSVTAVRRVNEFAPRLNQVINSLRNKGVTVIHSPSDCMPIYKNHAARRRALSVPLVTDLPESIVSWCHRIPEEENSSYPIDQSDGGEDEDEFENQQWAEKLKSEGRNPGTPWLRQTPTLEIKGEDYIASEGDVVWSILKNNKIKHVILSGVHTNMCVLGRPFGLRQMIRCGMDTVLMRDATDVMYNPRRWPYVSHFTGLDLVIRHIEENVCSTITTNQIIGGDSFRFACDKRPHIAIVTAAQKMKEWKTFSLRFFDSDFRVSYVDSRAGKGSSDIKDADCLLLSDSIIDGNLNELIGSYIESAKPIIGAGDFTFKTMNEVFGVKNSLQKNTINKKPISSNLVHPLVYGYEKTTWLIDGDLHNLTEASGVLPISYGQEKNDSRKTMVSWAYVRPDGGKSCATTLDLLKYKDEAFFQRFLFNAVRWATGKKLNEHLPVDPNIRRMQEGWALQGSSRKPSSKELKYRDLRTLIRIPDSVKQIERSLIWKSVSGSDLYMNGSALKENKPGEWLIPSDKLKSGELNLLVIRLKKGDPFESMPNIRSSQNSVVLNDKHWQEKFSNEESIDVNFPIPPQFGAPTDLIQEWTLRN